MDVNLSQQNVLIIKSESYLFNFCEFFRSLEKKGEKTHLANICIDRMRKIGQRGDFLLSHASPPYALRQQADLIQIKTRRY